MTELENPYKVLAVERTADERAIKKAYVALIRKFTPESHPEEFKKIRAAYELLTNAEARKRFDDSERGYDEYGEELGRRLTDVDDSLAKNKPELAKEILLSLVERFPDKLVVHERLGSLHLDLQENEKALAVFQSLVAKDPEGARHHLHCGLALMRLDRKHEVDRELAQARRLDSKDMTIALAQIDFYVATSRPREAVVVADSVLPHVERGSPEMFVLWLRKVKGFANAGDSAAYQQALDEVKRLADAANDSELGPFIAGQLSSIAARLYSNHAYDIANDLLARAPEFHPSAIESAIAVETSTTYKALPEAFRDWLTNFACGSEAKLTIRFANWLGPWFSTVITFGLLAFGYLFFSERRTMGVGTALAAAVLLGGLATLFVFSLRWAFRVGVSPVASFVTLHPLYLLRVTPLRIRFYPLFLLTNIQAVAQHVNGVYSTTHITITFGDHVVGKKNVSLSIRDKVLAKEWLDALVGIRARALELLGEGCLEAEHLVDALTPRMLRQLPPVPTSRTTLKCVAAGVVLGFAMTLGAKMSSARGESDAAFADAANGGLNSLRAYIGEHPKERHAAAAEEMIRSEYEQAEAAIATKPNDPAEKAYTQALAEARAQGGFMAVHVEIDKSLFPKFAPAQSLAEAHLETAFCARGLGILLTSPPGGGTKQPGALPVARVTARIQSGGSRALKSGDKLLVARGATVQVAIEVGGKQAFTEQVEVPAAETVYVTNGQDAEEVRERDTLERALDAAALSLRLYGPAARLTGADEISALAEGAARCTRAVKARVNKTQGAR